MSLVAQLLGQCFDTFAATGHDDDVCAFRGEQARGRFADATRSSSNQDDAAVQTIGREGERWRILVRHTFSRGDG
jgi:hypothetical protein